MSMDNNTCVVVLFVLLMLCYFMLRGDPDIIDGVRIRIAGDQTQQSVVLQEKQENHTNVK